MHNKNKMSSACSENLPDNWYLVGSEITDAEFMIGNLVVMSRFLGIDMDNKPSLTDYIKRPASQDAVNMVLNK